MRRPLLILTLSAAAAVVSAPAVADRWTDRAEAEARLDEARAQHRRERHEIHREFDDKARELSRKRFASAGDRAEAWRKLEDERQTKIADVDEDFDARVADYEKKRRD